ncbi:MAG: hypothetical protein QNK04_20850 [Myxococcota bacterium]|nr:hypothetical protein [Myxococcota bacterium]
MSRVVLCLLLASSLCLPGCAYQVAMSQSEDAVELDVTPSQMIIQGGTMASTRRFQFLFFGFGKRNSFLEAERQAIEKSGSELLVNRIRLKHFEGFLIPTLWFQALGVEGAQDLPVIGWEIYTVAGTGVRLVPQPAE